MKSNLTKDLVNALKNDKELYDVWEVNIAMAFYDEFHNNAKSRIHEIAHTAAKNFLDALVMTASA